MLSQPNDTDRSTVGGVKTAIAVFAVIAMAAALVVAALMPVFDHVTEEAALIAAEAKAVQIREVNRRF